MITLNIWAFGNSLILHFTTNGTKDFQIVVN